MRRSGSCSAIWSRRCAAWTVGIAWRSGIRDLENILSQPEFGGGEAQGVLELLRGGAFLSAVLPQLGEGREVQVFIGDENPTHALRRFGVILATYGVDGEVTGVVGVLGPTRMSYPRSISSVRYMARLMSDMVADSTHRSRHVRRNLEEGRLVR